MKEKKKQRKEIITNLLNTWTFAKKYKVKLILYFLTTLILSGISAFVPILSAKILLDMTGGLWKELLFVALTIFTIEMFRNIMWFFAEKLSQIFFREILLDVQVKIADETLKLETNVIDNNSSGIFIDRLNKDSNEIADIFIEVNASISDIIANIGVLIAIFIISKVFFCYFIVAIIILFIIDKMRIKQYYTLNKRYKEINEENTGLITELIRGLRDIRVLNAGVPFMNKMKERITLSNYERYKMSGVLRIFNLVSRVIRNSLSLIFIVLGVVLINNDLLTISSFVILYTYQNQVYYLLNYATHMIEIFKKFNVASTRVFEIIGDKMYKKEKFGNKTIKKVHGDFEFKNVNFSYNENALILNDVSFKIEANHTVAFVGKSGGGKSTIFNLLTKLYNIDSGDILIDNNSIYDLTKDSIRDNISIITQTPYIFNFTIKENLLIVKDTATDKEIIEACKTACLHDFIMTLPDKYDTKVGEGGVSLSGGQRQRLAIARALLKKTEIILFDEATSALDNETQKTISMAISNMKKEYTILIIAHRLSTIVESDKIIMIDDGKVIAEGTHHELLENCLEYKNLYISEVEK